MQTFETWYRSTLSAKLNPTDTEIIVANAPTVTAWRMHVYRWNTHAWIKYTWVSWSSLTGVTFVSQTANPTTSVTGIIFPAWSSIELAEMHDQMIDKQQPTDLLQVATTYATTAARDTALWGDGVATEPYVDIYVTTTGLYYNYNLSSGQWEALDVGTPTANASTTVAGKVEISTDAEWLAGTDTWGTWAILSLTPSQVQTLGRFGDWSDGNVTISSNTTLTRDMYYNNLTVDTGITLNPDGFIIYVLGTLTLTGTAKLIRNGNNGANASLANGWAGWAALNTGTCGPCGSWYTGGSGVVNSNAPGISSGILNPSLATTSTAWAAWGSGGTSSWGTPWWAWGTSGDVTQWPLYNQVWNLWNVLAYLANPTSWLMQYSGMPSWWSGWSGGGSGWQNGVWGGWSGGNGGIIVLIARVLTGTGTIEAKGGIGGNGENGNGGNSAAGWWGAGGSWGIVKIIYQSGTPYTCTLTGGAGGTGGTLSSGTAATAWATGTTWQSIIINV